MTVQIDSTVFGLAGLVVAASLLDAMRKRGLVDEDAVKEIMENAAVYVQAFGADHPPEIEQEARRILQMLAKSSREAIRELDVEVGASPPPGEPEEAIA
jgi:hypothetical protein